MLLSGSPAGTAVISCAVSTTAAGTVALAEDVLRPRGRNFFYVVSTCCDSRAWPGLMLLDVSCSRYHIRSACKGFNSDARTRTCTHTRTHTHTHTHTHTQVPSLHWIGRVQDDSPEDISALQG
jgi:hypothetical protein